MKKLDGKVAVITGAGSGMGLATARLFAQEGARIVACDWNEATLEAAVAEIKGTQGEIIGLKINVADKDQAQMLIDRAAEAYGRLDVLVNNAGVMDQNHAVGEVTDEMWRRVLSVNLDGPMFLTRRAIPIMRAQKGGSIVNISSVAGLEGAAAGVAYTVSKHALIGFTRNTAWRYQPDGIRCNAIAAGAVQTNIAASVDPKGMDPEGTKRWSLFYSLIPAMLQPTDIANLVLFLASDESRMINGAIIPADAGWTAA